MQAKKLVYVSMVRSKLDVRIPVWSAFHKKNLIKIEGVQRRVTRFIVPSDGLQGQTCLL